VVRATASSGALLTPGRPQGQVALRIRAAIIAKADAALPGKNAFIVLGIFPQRRHFRFPSREPVK
jgi:hypothetical protein